MRGYVEESEEVKAARRLRDAARTFGGCCLMSWTEVERYERGLYDAALAYAATQSKPKKRTANPRGK